MNIFKKLVPYSLAYLLGVYSVIIYFIYRSRTEFIPHFQALTGKQDIGMTEVFEWPLDILFPTVPIFIIGICIMFITHFVCWKLTST
ncbi:MAG: hypothetical protein WCW27_01510 [Patescibacteria group bacterium]|jgi:hypothetical protein